MCTRQIALSAKHCLTIVLSGTTLHLAIDLQLSELRHQGVQDREGLGLVQHLDIDPRHAVVGAPGGLPRTEALLSSVAEIPHYSTTRPTMLCLVSPRVASGRRRVLLSTFSRVRIAQSWGAVGLLLGHRRMVCQLCAPTILGAGSGAARCCSVSLERYGD